MTTMAERTRLAGALEVVARVEEIWRNVRLTDSDRQRYARDVCHADPAEVLAAVEVLARAGREFAPTAPMLLLEVARMQLDAPDWGDVKRQLVNRRVALEAARTEKRVWVCPHGECDGSGFVVAEADKPSEWMSSDCRCRPARRAAWRREDGLHSLVREFVSGGFVTWGEIDTVAAGEATTLEAQMRQKWDAFSARAVASRAIGQVEGPPSLRRLERGRQEDGARRGRRELGRPDYLASLPRQVA